MKLDSMKRIVVGALAIACLARPGAAQEEWYQDYGGYGGYEYGIDEYTEDVGFGGGEVFGEEEEEFGFGEDAWGDRGWSDENDWGWHEGGRWSDENGFGDVGDGFGWEENGYADDPFGWTAGFNGAEDQLEYFSTDW